MSIKFASPKPQRQSLGSEKYQDEGDYYPNPRHSTTILHNPHNPLAQQLDGDISLAEPAVAEQAKDDSLAKGPIAMRTKRSCAIL